jgi:hypothetical protein
VRVTSYLTDPGFAEVNGRATRDAPAGRLVPTTAIVVRTLADSGWSRSRSWPPQGDRRWAFEPVRALEP